MNNLLSNNSAVLTGEILASRAKGYLSEKKQVELSKRIREEINGYCAANMDKSHRRHLGASEIGHECTRYLWYKFHWMKPSVYIDYASGEDVTGRMLRLFNRGHREEPMLIKWLRSIGARVWEFDESLPSDKDGNPQQFRISGVNGHFGGSLDGIVLLPTIFDDYMLLEMKTYNAKRFALLVQSGVYKNDPKYYTQMVVYGKHYHMDFAVFIAACKDNDDIYVEIVNLAIGKRDADEAEAKAELIINSPTAPVRLSNNPTFYKCKTCEFAGICHKGETADVSCRSCKFAQPVEDKRWFCHRHQQLIPIGQEDDPDQFIKQACDGWEQIA
jgi:hypothetical protein